jgi:Spy/CpxP family protein refolding chaperone
MSERLALDDSQKASVEAIFERSRPAHQALRERSREHRKAMKALDPASADFSTQAQALADEAATLARDRVLQRTQMQSELSAVLTPEQMSKMKAGRHHKGHDKGHGKKWRHDKDEDAQADAS